jgi:hypothetical protein
VFTKEKNMEDNPFILENTDETPSLELPSDEESNETAESKIGGIKDEIPMPSSGVSTYTSVPAIGGGAPDCDFRTLTSWDKLNLWSVIIAVAFIALFHAHEIFQAAVRRTAGYMKKYAAAITTILLALTFAIFSKPDFFKTGISGNINIFTLIEFSAIIILGATTLTYTLAKAMCERNIIFKDREASFAGMKFLLWSSWTFLLTSILFLFFTESEIAFITLFIFACGNAAVMLIKPDLNALKGLKKLTAISIALQIALLGSLLGIYLIAAAGAAFAGECLSLEDNRRIKNILKSLV